MQLPSSHQLQTARTPGIRFVPTARRVTAEENSSAATVDAVGTVAQADRRSAKRRGDAAMPEFEASKG